MSRKVMFKRFSYLVCNENGQELARFDAVDGQDEELLRVIDLICNTMHRVFGDCYIVKVVE